VRDRFQRVDRGRDPDREAQSRLSRRQGTPPQDLKYNGEQTFVTIGDDNTLREFVTVNLATGTGETTTIGSRCLLMAYVHVAHNCSVGDEVILANAVNLAGHVHIDNFATVGGLTPIHQFVRIGKYAFIGAESRRGDIPRHEGGQSAADLRHQSSVSSGAVFPPRAGR
jgi:acyl-ACP--UDP-N-acetylglucosamine O-acyltransferase